ncbi:hypothetical protein LOTGIDRAFT_172796 [Lottia gigantea]|uniref:Uncharacterized protein n=1 Tax=Lottia gigantea TaxID=225164 RepID=V4AUS5_LOTGI|nr:hypothetical protein LOTGIDRAFT_172796 [Lottia gigantea]ESP01063.1 hypothetical protein LOTGIDRAFT_172796 [Lottia gigantea]
MQTDRRKYDQESKGQGDKGEKEVPSTSDKETTDGKTDGEIQFQQSVRNNTGFIRKRGDGGSLFAIDTTGQEDILEVSKRLTTVFDDFNNAEDEVKCYIWAKTFLNLDEKPVIFLKGNRQTAVTTEDGKMIRQCRLIILNCKPEEEQFYSVLKKIRARQIEKITEKEEEEKHKQDVNDNVFVLYQSLQLILKKMIATLYMM